MCQRYKWKRGMYRYAFVIKALVFIKLFDLVIDLNVCDKAEVQEGDLKREHRCMTSLMALHFLIQCITYYMLE